ncbi:MAG: hypothetical protein J0H64_05130 [Actinobacteria bacterium]|nr:hypothetical protein [Actinomycetota bacterium]
MYAAERLLRQLTSAIDQITLMFRDQAIGAPEGAYVQRFAVDPSQPPTVLEHFREFGVSLLAPDQYTRQLTQMGLPAIPPANGELNLLVLTVKEAKKSSRTESSCMLDLWAAAGLRDALHATLSKALPPLSPSYRPVQVVDGVVGSIPM